MRVSRSRTIPLLVMTAAMLPGQALIPGAQPEMGANLPALPIGPNGSPAAGERPESGARRVGHHISVE